MNLNKEPLVDTLVNLNDAQINLNKEQLAATQIVSGAAMVVAGAGCGKTRVITQRITNLIQMHGVVPERILALTFTNKAAKEMLERVKEQLSDSKATTSPFVGTFHSYCFFLLKKNSPVFGLENFGVLDSTDQVAIVKKILTKYGLEKEFTPRDVLANISARKNRTLIAPVVETVRTRKYTEIYEEYEKEKRLSNNLDFDDLILLVFAKLQDDEQFLVRIQSGISHILIDEYQDTNAVQHGLIKLLSNDRASNNLKIDSVFAVGDQDQSIYSWRGAIAENMNGFLDGYKDSVLIKIQQNYRSPNELLSAANHLIKNNSARHKKELWSNNQKRNCIFVAHCKNEYQEAGIIAASIIRKHLQEPQVSCAVLYRNHYQSRLIEEALIQNKVLYNIVGGIKFYERKEIKDLLAYLKLIANSRDWLSLGRVLNCPNRGLGDRVIEKLDDLLREGNYNNFINLLTDLSRQLSQEKQKQAVASFLEIFSPTLTSIDPTSVLERILEKTQYFAFLEKEYSEEEAETKIKNIWELQKSIKSLEESRTDSTTVKVFLEEIALIQDADLASQGDTGVPPVQLMTLHSAKGLEFDFVTIVGLEDGNLPSLRMGDTKSIEEERRLAYVGITRSKDKLLLCYSQNRSEFGRLCSYSISRFIQEIPRSLLSQNEQGTSSLQLKAEICRWLTAKECVAGSKEPKPEAKISLNPKEPNTVAFRINQAVTHKTFGVGIIKKIISEGSSVLLEIAFLNYGTKKINSKFVS